MKSRNTQSDGPFWVWFAIVSVVQLAMLGVIAWAIIELVKWVISK